MSRVGKCRIKIYNVGHREELAVLKTRVLGPVNVLKWTRLTKLYKMMSQFRGKINIQGLNWAFLAGFDFIWFNSMLINLRNLHKKFKITYKKKIIQIFRNLREL